MRYLSALWKGEVVGYPLRVARKEFNDDWMKGVSELRGLLKEGTAA
jgi:hypothetical protein